MSLKPLIAACIAALMITPALALAGSGNSSDAPGHNKTTPTQTTPNGNAYGFYCKGFSKKHVKGTKGTPYSRCVKAAAKLNKDLSPTP